MVNEQTQEGDLIVVLAGLDVPMILTSVEGEVYYRIVREACEFHHSLCASYLRF
jgi:hypothetical protein